MNKNEPIIINKAGEGYIIKPLSYMFHDEGEETFLAFSSMTELTSFLLEHFETQAGGAILSTNHTSISHEKVVAIEKQANSIGEALTKEITTKGIKYGQARTKPKSSSTSETK